MATLPESSEWADGVYQIERSDPVGGGPEGAANKPLKALTNRTRWLYDKFTTAFDGFGWMQLGNWAVGLEVSLRTQIVNFNDTWYRYRGNLDAPHVIEGDSPDNDGGIWSSSNPDGLWVDVGDSALISLILNATGSAGIEAAISDLATAAYSIKNRRLLGLANNKLRSGAAVNIVCVGDSITYGYDVTSSDKLDPLPGHTTTRAPIQYPARLQDKLNFFTDSVVTVFNRGYSGDTAYTCYNRWPENPACHVAHIMLGINDAFGRHDATFEQYGEYYEKLIRRYIDWGHGVVIHTASAQTFNNANQGGTRYTQYVRSLAESYGCPVFESEGVHQYCRFAQVYSDATHFNKAGYAKYGDAVAAFILASGWVRPVRPLSATAMQQPGRSTEGIGWYGAKGAKLGVDEANSYTWNGQTGKLDAGGQGVHSFSFFLEAEAANIYAVARLNGATISLSDPVTTVEGQEAANTIPLKFMPRHIAETKSYTVSSRPAGYKSWMGSLVGRGWKTVYIQQNSDNTAAVYVNELVIEPCDPDLACQSNDKVVPAVKEIWVFNCPVTPISSPQSVLPAKESMPLKVYFPLPKGLFRQSQIWSNWYDNLKLEISLTTRASNNGDTYNGVHKLVAFTTTSANGANLASIETMFKSQPNCLKPSSITYGYAYPNAPEVITENTYPQAIPGGRQMYLVLNFPANPAAYYSLEVECSSILHSNGNFMY
ncbi:SGNH/GDSL hydrolase family protein [Citrobacter sp. RHBSTW-00678]|uniref:SGNH/GDSL hydrolase family protein n=1 Tax=Citrobacter sp. RHBSTW-00678 TaxID=2742661 RepID=UPI0015E90E67|nr:SGNH/GDSL hydrolase family protein [Citrobacter sp. RHBSTW-00678]QLV87854.1 SGNH/GDSL hydrolase family protein [Citrobacter sp. RHBSTW-00678]